MRILSRYIFCEFLGVFLMTLAATTALMMGVIVLVEAQRQGVGLAQVLQIFPYLLPEASRFSVPGTTLFAACNVYGRCSSANEIVAIKALGISPMVLLWPVLVFGVLSSAACVWLNEAAITWGREGVQRVIIQSAEQIAYSMLQTQRSYAAGNMAISVRRVEGRRLIKPTFALAEADKPNITITADEAELASDPKRGTITIRFYNAMIDVGDGDGGITWPGTYEHVVDFNQFSVRGESAGPSSTPLASIPQAIRDQRAEIVRLEQQTAAQIALRMMAGRVEELAGKRWIKAEERIAIAQRKLYRLQTEPPRRWANGASCFCFIFIGAPLAVLMRTKDSVTSFFLVFGPILACYYPFLVFAVDQAKKGSWPPSAVWLGNIVCLAAGAYCLRKVLRY
jgi:lipopolysaccharide export system permease protein